MLVEPAFIAPSLSSIVLAPGSDGANGATTIDVLFVPASLALVDAAEELATAALPFTAASGESAAWSKPPAIFGGISATGSRPVGDVALAESVDVSSSCCGCSGKNNLVGLHWTACNGCGDGRARA